MDSSIKYNMINKKHKLKQNIYHNLKENQNNFFNKYKQVKFNKKTKDSNLFQNQHRFH